MSVPFSRFTGIAGGIGIGPQITPPPIEERISKIKTVPMSKTIVNGTTWQFMASEKVTAGKIWEVTRIAMGVTSDISATIAGTTVYIYIATQVPQDGAAGQAPSGATDLLANALTIPNVTFPVKTSIYLQAPERIIVAVKGATANGELGGIVAIIEHDVQALLRSLVPLPPIPLASGRAPDNPSVTGKRPDTP